MNKELMDESILTEGFNLSRLWLMREELNKVAKSLGKQGKIAVNLKLSNKANNIKSQLHYILGNIRIVERVMSNKELDIFETTEYGQICAN